MRILARQNNIGVQWLIGKFRYSGNNIAEDIRQKYGFDGDLARIFTENQGPVVHKWHHYIPIYDRYFSKYRGTGFRFLEIGVSKGGSLQMWREYFGQDAIVTGIDIDPECAQFDGQSGNVRIGSQDDPGFLTSVVEEMGGLDVVLDDGSHHMAHVRASLDTLFPLLSIPGLYMVEDLHTAYWKDYGGGPVANANFFRTMGGMVDDLHNWAHGEPPQVPSTNGSTTAFHIHDSIAVIEKGIGHQPVHSRVGKR